MTPSPTEQLIVELARDAQPVDRLPSVAVRWTVWLACAAAATAIGVWVIGIRGDVASAAQLSAAASLAGGLIAALCAAAAALHMSVPGSSAGRWLKWVPLIVIGAAATTLAVFAERSGASLLAEPVHAACGLRILLLSALPSWLLFRELRRGLTLSPLWAASLASLGGTTLAAATVQLACPIDRPAHLLVAHLLSAVALAAMISLVGVRFVRAPR